MRSRGRAGAWHAGRKSLPVQSVSTSPGQDLTLARPASGHAGLIALPIAVLAALTVFSRISSNTRLVVAFLGAAGALAAWGLLLAWGARRLGSSLAIEWVPPLRAHWIQGAVQVSLYVH